MDIRIKIYKGRPTKEDLKHIIDRICEGFVEGIDDPVVGINWEVFLPHEYHEERNLAVSVAKEHGVSGENQRVIENLIVGAFRSYAMEWKAYHKLSETRHEWSFFFDLLTEHRGHMETAIPSLLQHSNPNDQWILNYKRVIEIILGIGSHAEKELNVGECFERWREAYKEAYGKYPKVKLIGEVDGGQG